MGTVYLARQQQPIRREVALKVVKPGINSSQVLERFEDRASAAGSDGLSQRCACVGCGDIGARPPVFRHGIRRRSSHHPVLRPEGAQHPHSAAICLFRSAMRCSTRTKRASSTAT
jgi:hypothetical protein